MDGILYLQKMETIHNELLCDVKQLKKIAVAIKSYEMAGALRDFERKLQEYISR
jgi:hypothetical protein